MIFRETAIAGAFVIALEPHADARGHFVRTWCRRELEEHGLVAEVVQCNAAVSRSRGTLRGIHYQMAPFEEAKVVRCTRGAAFDVVVDLRPGSPTYLRWVGTELGERNGLMVYVPEGCGHGYLTLADATEIAYQTSAFYSAEHERGVHYADPAIGIRWPIPVEVVSERDLRWPFLATGVQHGFEAA
jgi:dTDP-4-dehydrorhamnose 3,5-epimerase